MSEIDETIARNGTSTSPAGEADTLAVADAEATTSESAPPETIGDGVSLAAPDVTPTFLSELSVAMRTVVGRERDRIAAIVKDDAAAHSAQAREQSAAEAEAFQRVADEDVAAIEAWADQEVERIREEAARKIADRQSDLEAYLGQHAAVLEGELEGIDTAISDYESKVGVFLDELDTIDDPAVIAERAHALPRPPDLETVRSLARAETLTRLAEASMADDLAADEAVGAEAAETDAVDSIAAAGEPEAPVLDVASVVTSAVGVEAQGSGDGWDSPTTSDAAASDVAATDPVDIGLGAMIDEAATDRPVAVMDPEATGPAAATWPSADVPTLAPVGGAGQDDSPGHPNAAVRLIRTVAPWTAPHHDGDDRPTQPG